MNQHHYSIEERVYRIQTRLELLRGLAQAENHAAVDAEDVMGGLEQVVEDCLEDVRALKQLPVSVQNLTDDVSADEATVRLLNGLSQLSPADKTAATDAIQALRHAARVTTTNRTRSTGRRASPTRRRTRAVP